jgi:glycosyltransferase involved in cell wall biosynthesis
MYLPQDIPVVGIIHSDDPRHYQHLRELGRYWNVVVAVSAEIGRKVKRVLPSVAERLATIPYGVDVPRSAPRNGHSGPLRLLYAGRIEHEQKRVLDLPGIVTEAVQQGVPVRLTVVGSGEALGRLHQASADHIRAGRMVLCEAVPNTAMSGFFREADIFVLPSAFEGLPLALLEAMGHGCVPVTTDIPSGIPQVVQDGINGFRVPVGSYAGFARCFAALWRDPGLRQRLATNATLTVAESYSADRMVSDYLSLFERALADARSGRYRRPWAFPGQWQLCRWKGRMVRLIRRCQALILRPPGCQQQTTGHGHGSNPSA